jgi:hypothetical protein
MVWVRRAKLVRADMEQRQGHVAEAARTFLEVHRWAEVNACVPLQARSHFHLALTYHYLGTNRAASTTPSRPWSCWMKPRHRRCAFCT